MPQLICLKVRIVFALIALQRRLEHLEILDQKGHQETQENLDYLADVAHQSELLATLEARLCLVMVAHLVRLTEHMDLLESMELRQDLIDHHLARTAPLVMEDTVVMQQHPRIQLLEHTALTALLHRLVVILESKDNMARKALAPHLELDLPDTVGVLQEALNLQQVLCLVETMDMAPLEVDLQALQDPDLQQLLLVVALALLFLAMVLLEVMVETLEVFFLFLLKMI